MKLLVFAVVVLQLTNYVAAQCVAPWMYVDEQCMICNANIPLAPATADYSTAQASCVANKGNLATITSNAHDNFAFTCGTTPWIGFTDQPFNKFIDGKPFVNFGFAAPGAGTLLGCYHMTALRTWFSPGTCNGPFGYACSKPTSTCLALDVHEPLDVSYDQPGTTAHPAGWKWVGTEATYKCAAGFTMVGANTRTCQESGSWSGTEPHCEHMGLCPALVQADHSTLTYSGAAAGNSKYTVGMFATQKCVADYELEEGSYFRVCLPDGTWNGGMIVCEKENNNALALGLGLGLGLLALVGIILLLWCCLCRPGGMGAPPPPARPGYPRPRPGYPRPVRGYPRRVY